MLVPHRFIYIQLGELFHSFIYLNDMFVRDYHYFLSIHDEDDNESNEMNEKKTECPNESTTNIESIINRSRKKLVKLFFVIPFDDHIIDDLTIQIRGR